MVSQEALILLFLVRVQVLQPKNKKSEVFMKKWTKESAERYITRIDKSKGIRGLTYWSARDYLKNHKSMHFII